MAHTPRNESEKATLEARRAWCYLVLVFFSFLCLFFFYILVINSTRTHFEIQKGFSLLPGKSLVTNFKNVLADANIPVVSGIRNSLIVSACSAALSVSFSALTAYGIYAYQESGVRHHPAHHDHADAGVGAGLPPAHHQDGVEEQLHSADRAQHCGPGSLLLHEAVSGRQPPHGDRGIF